ncbi:hypothetical protein D1AOALGA4SA_5084 [Olavius algarvensis Delta 1 endosymbiont]|nr:hypothetical protein D1AOALGA4SA_5084 [Olavius algarvensis Delta 1 endosymbiont]
MQLLGFRCSAGGSIDIRHSLKFHKSGSRWPRASSLIKDKKLMNVEHRTSNIERRIMYSIYFKSTERSDSIIIHYSLFNSHFMVVS